MRSVGADSLSAQAMGQELHEKAAPGEPDALQKRIAEERAGLLQVPNEAAIAKASPFERYFRALANLGDEAEQALAVVLGGEKDATLPVQLARSVGKALKDEGVAAEYVEFKGGGHSDLIVQDEFAATVAAFFARIR